MISPQTCRQILILSGLYFCSMSDGYIFGQTSGMVAALGSPDSEIELSESDLSWIASLHNVTCLVGFFLAGATTKQYGRRKTIALLNIPVLANWIMLYYANSFIILIITRVIVGACFGGVLMLGFIATAEYTSPNKRAFFINLVGSGMAVGTAFGHILSTVFHWRTVALLGVIPTGLSALLPWFWVESPSWLASKGRFEECKQSLKAIHGDNDGTEKELQLLIELEKIKFNKEPQDFLQKIRTTLQGRNLVHIICVSIAISVYRTAGSKMLFSTFIISMIQGITGKSDILAFTLLVDGFAVVGALISCVLITKMKMRTLLFSLGIPSNICLLLLSICLYFKPDDDTLISWVICTLMAFYLIAISAGPYSVLETLHAEIFPLDIKEYCFYFFGIISTASMFTSIKFASEMFKLIGYHGVFFINCIIVSLCFGYLWVKMPETKGRTLAEIELYFKNQEFDKDEDVIHGARKKMLV